MEDAVSIFGFKAEVMIVTDRDGFHVPAELNNIILYYTSNKKSMTDSQCEIMWDNNSGAVLGLHPTGDYGAAPNSPEKQAIITQHSLRYKMLGICIKKSLTTDSKLKLRAFTTAYTFNNQYDGATFFCHCKNGALRWRPQICPSSNTI